MTNNKNKTVNTEITKLRGRTFKAGFNKPLLVSVILELADRIEALETSAKASEPKECKCVCKTFETPGQICSSYSTINMNGCPVHDGDESTSVEHCVISKEELQPSISHNDSAKYMNDLIQDRVMRAVRHLIGKTVNIKQDLIIKLEFDQKNER